MMRQVEKVEFTVLVTDVLDKSELRGKLGGQVSSPAWCMGDDLRPWMQKTGQGAGWAGGRWVSLPAELDLRCLREKYSKDVDPSLELKSYL